MFTVRRAKFDPDAFLKHAKLKLSVVWHKGDPVLR